MQRRGGDRLVTAAHLMMAVVTVVWLLLMVMVVGKLLGRHVMLVLGLGRRLRQVHVATGGSGHGPAATTGRSSAEAARIATAGTTGEDAGTAAATGMVMMCRVNLGWTIDLLWKTRWNEEREATGKG